MQAMATPRFFSGSRSSSGSTTSSVSAMMRAQLKKDKKINFAEINKKLLQNKLMEAKLKAMTGEKKSVPSMVGGRTDPPSGEGRTKRSQEIIKMVMQREKDKADKAAKKAVTVEAKRLVNGKVDEKGRIYDSAGNLIGKVNLKNGNMSTSYGQHIGVYKAKSYMTKMAMEQAINKNSPFLINQRKMIEVKKQEQIQQEAKAREQSNNFWGASGKDIWGNPIADFFGNLL
jgi:hypothetical protein